LLRPLVPGDLQVVASGGALLNSPAWLQIVTDVLGRPVAVCGVAEATSRGAALLALEALGAIKSLDEIPHFIQVPYQPDSRRHARYLEAIRRQQDLYGKLVAKENSESRSQNSE
jgi:gluconokinase